MSLTKFINNKDVRAMFRLNTFKPKSDQTIMKSPILAPPQNKHYMLIGTAFDYLMRFYLERNTLNIESRRWIAQAALDKLRLLENYDLVDTINFNNLILKEYNDSYLLYNNDEKLIIQVTKSLIYSTMIYNDYIETGIIKNELFISCILLAKCDSVFRGGYIDENMGLIDKNDVQDLKKLMDIIPKQEFINKNRCILNPTFGKGSELVGGADADLIIDDELIDIKTTKNLQLNRDMFNQIFGYYVLNRINGNNDINKISIYFSRHGIKYTYNISDIASEDEIQKFIKIFNEKAYEIYGKSKNKDPRNLEICCEYTKDKYKMKDNIIKPKSIIQNLKKPENKFGHFNL
jgi:hypothetical protein